MTSTADTFLTIFQVHARLNFRQTAAFGGIVTLASKCPPLPLRMPPVFYALMIRNMASRSVLEKIFGTG